MKIKIGISLNVYDAKSDIKGEYYSLSGNEIQALQKSKSTIIYPLYHDVESIPVVMNHLDAVVIPGNQFNIAEILSAESRNAYLPDFAIRRLIFETQLLRCALNKGIPIFGICGGMQVIGSALGFPMITSVQKITGNPSDHGALISKINNQTILQNSAFTRTFFSDARKMLPNVSAKKIVSCRHTQGFSVIDCEQQIKKTGLELEILETTICGTLVESFQLFGRLDNLKVVSAIGTQYHPERNYYHGLNPKGVNPTHSDDEMQNCIDFFIDYVKSTRGKTINNNIILNVFDEFDYIGKLHALYPWI